MISPKHVDMFLTDLPCAVPASTRPCAGSRSISSIRHELYEIDAILCHARGARHPKTKISTEMTFCDNRLPTSPQWWQTLSGNLRHSRMVTPGTLSSPMVGCQVNIQSDIDVHVLGTLALFFTSDP